MAHRISNWFMILSTLLFFLSLSSSLDLLLLLLLSWCIMCNVHACYYSSASFTCVMLIKALLFNRIHIFTLNAPRTLHILASDGNINWLRSKVHRIHSSSIDTIDRIVCVQLHSCARCCVFVHTVQLVARDFVICCVPYRRTTYGLPWWSLLLPSTANCSPKIALLFHWKSKCIFRSAICPFYQW